jgi:ribosomal protein S18 acetylase RimI-like enzyme
MSTATPTLVFRAARPDDVDALVALVQSAYRGDASRAGWTTEADLLDGQRTDREGVARTIADPGSRIVLAESDGKLMACAHIECQPRGCYFGMFSVNPTSQGGGIGDRLIRECERIARDEWHCATVFMTVIRQRDELIAWYERRGYAKTGERKPFPYGDARFGTPKRDDLEFIVLEKRLAGV